MAFECPSKFRQGLNQSFCLAMKDGKWRVAKKRGDKILVVSTATGKELYKVCTVDDVDQYRNFTESLEYQRPVDTHVEILVGDTMVVDGVLYYVVDVGFPGEDGTIGYTIAR